jgi:hypothetical protein
VGKPAAQLSSLETHEVGVLESLKKFCGMKFVCEFFPCHCKKVSFFFKDIVRPKKRGLKTVFRIRDILVCIRIRIRGTMPLTYGSGCGSGSFYFHH